MTVLFLHAVKCKSEVKGYISVSQFGAKGNGVADDAGALEKTMIYCVKNNLVCYIPKTSKFYNITSTIRVPLSPGESLIIKSNGAIIRPLLIPVNKSAYNLTSFREHIFLSIGKQISSVKNANLSAFSEKSSIDISNLIFDGGSLSGVIATNTFDTDIFIGLQALAENVRIIGCTFKQIFGYGVRIHNVKTSVVSGSDFSDIYGRGATPHGQRLDFDGFGDGLYYALVKKGGSIKIENCKFKAKKVQNKRSRSGITFEYSTQPYAITLNDLSIQGFAKCVHIEETARSIVNINHVNLSDFNFAIANVLNDSSVINIKNSIIKTGINDGNDKGDALAFLNYQSEARINVDSSYLNFVGRNLGYQSAVGLRSVKNSVINANGTNFFFADGSTLFANCTFVNFGGRGKSFSSNDPKNRYQILNSTLKDCGPIHSGGEKLLLNIKNMKIK